MKKEVVIPKSKDNKASEKINFSALTNSQIVDPCFLLKGYTLKYLTNVPQELAKNEIVICKEQKTLTAYFQIDFFFNKRNYSQAKCYSRLFVAKSLAIFLTENDANLLANIEKDFIAITTVLREKLIEICCNMLLVNANHDEAVYCLNQATRQGVCLSHNQMNLILKKFQSTRFGTISEANDLFNFIQARFVKGIITNSSRETEYEMNEVLLRRNLLTSEQHINNEKKRFDVKQDAWTYVGLMQAYVNGKQYDQAHNLFVNYDHYRSDFSCATYLTCINSDPKLKASRLQKIHEQYKRWIDLAKQQYLCEQKPANHYFSTGNHLSNCRREPRTHMKMIRFDRRKALEIFQEAIRLDPSLEDDEYLFREVLKVMRDNRESVSNITKFFDTIPNKLEPTYQILFNVLYKDKLYHELLRYLQEARRLHLFHENRPKVAFNGRIEVDVHNHYIMGGGAPTASAFGESLIFTLILEAFGCLLADSICKEQPFLKISIICGQGKKRTTLESTKKLLREKIGLAQEEVKEEIATLHIQVRAEKLKFYYEKILRTAATLSLGDSLKNDSLPIQNSDSIPSHIGEKTEKIQSLTRGYQQHSLIAHAPEKKLVFQRLPAEEYSPKIEAADRENAETRLQPHALKK